MFDGVGLLERAISYTLGSLHLVHDDLMARQTPCHAWNLRALLAHLNDSLAALHEAVDAGNVSLRASEEDSPEATDPVGRVRERATELLGAWTNTSGPGTVWIADAPLTAELVSGTGALELAVHGWDVAMACGTRRPIPHQLAEQMLALMPMFVTDADRPARFAAPIPLPRQAPPADRLVAMLGRQP